MNKNKKEGLLVIIVVLIILFVLFEVIYSIFNTNENLRSNSYENKSQDVEIYDDLNNTDEEYVDESTSSHEEEIATYTSTLYDRDANRVDNITLAISHINNYVLKVGEEFSFNGVVGPMDEAHGFKKAVGFDTYGNKIQVPGGGMSQISSTMYNAALIANLEVTERHPHSRRVYYVPKDKDATIFYDTLDLKFKNNTTNDIKIQASNDSQNVTIKLLKIVKEKK